MIKHACRVSVVFLVIVVVVVIIGVVVVIVVIAIVDFVPCPRRSSDQSVRSPIFRGPRNLSIGTRFELGLFIFLSAVSAKLHAIYRNNC